MSIATGRGDVGRVDDLLAAAIAIRASSSGVIVMVTACRCRCRYHSTPLVLKGETPRGRSALSIAAAATGVWAIR